MPLTDIFLAQLTDPFRIGLIIALVLTMVRTRAVTGTALPLALGVGFIALMIPMTTQSGSAEPLWRLAAVGVVVNLIWLAVVLAVRAVILRSRG